MTKKYYFPNDEHIDEVFGGSELICLDRKEVDRLARDWTRGTENTLISVWRMFHEATESEKEEYGVYDSNK